MRSSFAVLGIPFLLSGMMATGTSRAAIDAQLAITGRITDAGTGTPLSGALVWIDGTSTGTLSDTAGRYTLTAPAALVGDSVRIVVERIGHARAERMVEVAADGVTADFELTPHVIGLQSIIVRGSGGQIQRRQLGASVAHVTAAAPHPDPGTESYASVRENGFLHARTHPLSTFAIDVDRASYANVRRFIRAGSLPPKDAVRIEELINYFPYGDAGPGDDAPFAVHTEIAPAPWQPAHRLVRVGLQGRHVDSTRLPPGNLVFLVDVSGSMDSPDKLPLLRRALALLVRQLRPEDRIALVVYAGSAGLVLPSTPGSDQATILAAIERLEAGGSTAGGAGLRLAYDIAARDHLAGGNNRVILATDGDFNVGPSSDEEMIRLIEERRTQGTFLTVLGFGTGNLKDSKMEALADHGNGNYAYIDDLLEARKVLVTEMGGTLLTIASDVKVQVEFNPARVAGYRLIGYENRLLEDEDFADDAKDAGELGAGHAVTALYEIVPVGAESGVELRGGEPLRYGVPAPAVTPTGRSDEIMYVKLRYKRPGEPSSQLFTHVVRDDARMPSADFDFAAAVAAWGMVLRDSPYRGSADLDLVGRLAWRGLDRDAGGHRAEFLRLVDATRALLPGAAADRGQR